MSYPARAEGLVNRINDFLEDTAECSFLYSKSQEVNPFDWLASWGVDFMTLQNLLGYLIPKG